MKNISKALLPLFLIFSINAIQADDHLPSWFPMEGVQCKYNEGKGPKAIVNRDVCPLTLPACSLLKVPYGHGFENDPCMLINDGDSIRFERKSDVVSITVLQRA